MSMIAPFCPGAAFTLMYTYVLPPTVKINKCNLFEWHQLTQREEKNNEVTLYILPYIIDISGKNVKSYLLACFPTLAAIAM